MVRSIRIVAVWLFLQAQSAFAFFPPSEGQDPGMQMLFMIPVFFIIFYFILIRPQKKEQQRHQERIANLKKGDRIVTGGGVHGTVKGTKEKTLVVEIAEGVKVTLNRQSVSAVLEPEAGRGRKGADEEEEEDGS